MSLDPRKIGFDSSDMSMLSIGGHSNRQHYEIDECLEDNREDY